MESPILASMRWILNEQYRRVRKLEEENQTLKDKIEFLTKCLDDRDKSIELLKEENKKLSEWKIIYASEKEQRHHVDILEENRKLKEANKNLIIQRDAYCKDYERAEEENRNLKERIKELEKDYDRLKVAFEDVVRWK